MTHTEETLQQPASMAHRLARLLRHEVGDLLQSVYSTVAILQAHLPVELAQERQLLNDLKRRAELCRFELDAALDLVSPVRLSPTRVDLKPLVHSALSQLRRRCSSLSIHFEETADLIVNADAQALVGMFTLLLLAFGESARKQLKVQLVREQAEVRCILERDGFSLRSEHLAWLEQPFASTQHALFGLALALSRRILEASGGSLAVESLEGGGVCVRLVFPVADA